MAQPDRRHRRPPFRLADLSDPERGGSLNDPRDPQPRPADRDRAHARPSRRAVPSATSGMAPARADVAMLARLIAVDGPARDGPGSGWPRALTASSAPPSSSSDRCCPPAPICVGEQVAADLAELQDRLPPFPGEAAAPHHRGRARPPDRPSCSESFDEEPVSAASIAQVHFAIDPGRARSRGQGAAARDRGGLRPRSRPVPLGGRARRAQPAPPSPPAGRGGGADLRRHGAVGDGPADGGSRRSRARRQLRRRSDAFRCRRVDWHRTCAARSDAGAHPRHQHGRPGCAAGRRPRDRRGADQGRRDRSSIRFSATAISTATSIPATCSSTPRATSSPSISASWAGSTAPPASIWPTCCSASSTATIGGWQKSISRRASCPPSQSVDIFAQACRSIGEPIFGQAAA